MALHRVSLRLAHDVTWPQRRKWSVTFWLDTANPATAAAAVAVAYTVSLRSALDATCFAYEAYATDTNPATESFSTVAIPSGSQRGTRVGGNNEKYLAKACVRVPFLVANSRNSFKFWRPGLNEADVVDGAGITETLATLITGAFNDFRDEVGPALVDPDGQPFSGIGALRLTTREFGRLAGNDLPTPPAVA